MSLILSGTDGLSDVDGSAATPAIRGTDANTGIFFPAADTIAFAEGGAEAMRIDSSGYILAGYSSVFDTSPAGTGQYAGISSSTSSASNWKFGALSFSADSVANGMLFVKSRSATVGTNTVVQSGDALGNITWRGADGTNYINAASIQAFVDGTPGTNDMPGRLTFSTTADGAASQTERMRIDSSGNLLVGTTTAQGRLTITGSTSDSTAFTLTTEAADGTDQLRVRCDGAVYMGLDGGSPYNLTNGAAANAVLLSDGFFYRSTSSLRYKKEIQNATHGLAEVLTLRPVTYKGTSPSDGENIYGGLIAEEVHEAGLTEFVQYDNEGRPDALHYGNMVSLCVKAIQEQQALITALTARITALEAQNADNPPQGETP